MYRCREREQVPTDLQILSMSSERVYIRNVRSSDRREVVALASASIDLHQPWISPPLTPSMFKSYLRRCHREDHEGLVVCLVGSEEIVGVININNIVRGSFLSASLGYYSSAKHQGLGYMTEALELVVRYAFEHLGLHRVEANIQPHNRPSRNLVQRCGFVLEGESKEFLFINGGWRDHERWVRTDARRSLTRG